jgi:hypothetical protein
VDGFFGVLLFLVFILAPLIEQVRKHQKGQQPPTRRPPTTLPPSRLPQSGPRSQTEEVSAKPRESASTMIPEDLWQILTGEQRPSAQTLPPPSAPPRKAPWDVVYIPPEEAADEEAAAVADVNVELERTTPEAVRREHERRHKQRDERSLEVEPTIVSLETGVPTGAARHAAFHDKLAQTAPPLAVVAATKRGLLGIGNIGELRRAFILQEVLGRPRGLE